MKFAYSKNVLLSSAVSVLLAQAALAQTPKPTAQASGSSEKMEELEAVIVTGTLLRGVAPESAQLIGLDKEDMEATGALSTPQMLANIPQLIEFNSTPAVVGSNNVQVNINRVNLRGLPGSGGGSSTLELLNGHRVVGAGIKSTAPDPDFLPPAAIERIEVVPDGGSSVYGADAVGGVLNLITRRRFNGVQFDAHYGSADNYAQYDASLTMGADWGSGSAYVAYNHLTHDSIYGRDRDYVKYINWDTGQGAESTCAGNVTTLTTGQRFVVSGAALVPGRNYCDRTDYRTIYPEEDRNSVFASVMQEWDAMTLDVHGYFTRRANKSDEGPRAAATTVSAFLPYPPPIPLTPNPFYRQAPGANNESQSVQVVFTPFGDHSIDRAVYETWGISPSLTVDLPANWQLRTTLNYGATVTTVANPQINSVALGTAAALGQFNPYDVTANSPAVLTSIGNWEIYGRTENELLNGRAVVDGALFKLPGGDLRVAVGVEYLWEGYSARIGNSVPFKEESTLTLYPSHRHTNAGFVELNLPIFGEDFSFTGMKALGLSLSGRYDDYSDFGSTTNPSIGINYEPAEWLTLRGRWGTSFQAPSLADSAAADNSITPFPSSIIVNPFQPPAPTQSLELAYQGGAPGIVPQEATIWSAGFDLKLPESTGLTLSGTYYNIKFDDIVSIPPVFIPTLFFSQFNDLFVINPTPQQVIDFINSGPNAAQNLATVNSRGGPAVVYALLDARRRNLGRAEVSGVDATLRWLLKTSFGSVYSNLNGTYRLSNDLSANATAPLASRLDSESRLRYSLALGGSIGEHVRGQVTYLYNSGFDITPSVTNNYQTNISPYYTINMFMQYDVLGKGFLNDLSVNLSVNNLTDHDPPLYQGLFSNLTYGYGNGGTVGRLVQFGVTKKFQ